MCGRYVLYTTLGDTPDDLATALIDWFSTTTTTPSETHTPPAFTPNYNIAPSTHIPIITGPHPTALTHATWGLTPSWARPTMRPMINARQETMLDKPYFRHASRHGRILIPASGYYEWSITTRRPHYITHPRLPFLAFAGLYEPSTRSAAIVTTAAEGDMVSLHDRTPLILPPDLWGAWLNPDLTSENDIRAIVDTAPTPTLITHEVGREVGSVKNNGPQLIAPIQTQDSLF